MQRQLSVAINHEIPFQVVVRTLCKLEALPGTAKFKYHEGMREFIPYS